MEKCKNIKIDRILEFYYIKFRCSENELDSFEGLKFLFYILSVDIFMIVVL